MNDALVEKILEGARLRLERQLRSGRYSDNKVHGSPIEAGLAAACNAVFAVEFGAWVVSTQPNLEDVNCKQWLLDRGERMPDVFLFPQVRIGSYRVDFFGVYPRGLSGVGGLVVECDGHDFHERTKGQAERDRSRDRDLLSLGYPVLRFTGSEIWRDPMACAHSVIHELVQRSGNAHLGRLHMQEGNVDKALAALEIE